jgi:hypothetical protein
LSQQRCNVDLRDFENFDAEMAGPAINGNATAQLRVLNLFSIVLHF